MRHPYARLAALPMLLTSVLLCVVPARASLHAASVTLIPSRPSPPPVDPRLLHQGSRGERVRGLQWLLGGHRPSKFRIATFPHKPNGLFGKRTASAVVEMKRRLGWPADELKPVAGDDVVDILTGKRARPIGYLRRATARLAADKQIRADRASTACAKRLIALERGELGVHEQPWGSNDGARVRVYQAVTGAFHAPWCASFQMWALKLARLAFPKTAWSGAIADNSAGVFYIVGWARSHGWLRALPKPGYLVAFVDRLGHVGLVERVSKSGITSLEGNASDAVRERFHPFGRRPMVFVRVPGCAGG